MFYRREASKRTFSNEDLTEPHEILNLASRILYLIKRSLTIPAPVLRAKADPNGLFIRFSRVVHQQARKP
jgi:hypothetical protein